MKELRFFPTEVTAAQKKGSGASKEGKERKGRKAARQDSRKGGKGEAALLPSQRIKPIVAKLTGDLSLTIAGALVRKSFSEEVKQPPPWAIIPEEQRGGPLVLHRDTSFGVGSGWVGFRGSFHGVWTRLPDKVAIPLQEGQPGVVRLGDLVATTNGRVLLMAADPKTRLLTFTGAVKGGVENLGVILFKREEGVRIGDKLFPGPITTIGRVAITPFVFDGSLGLTATLFGEPLKLGAQDHLDLVIPGEDERSPWFFLLSLTAQQPGGLVVAKVKPLIFRGQFTARSGVEFSWFHQGYPGESGEKGPLSIGGELRVGGVFGRFEVEYQGMVQQLGLGSLVYIGPLPGAVVPPQEAS